MPTPEEYRSAIASCPSLRAAAKYLGVNKETVRRFRDKELLRGEEVKKPVIPDKNLPVEEIIKQAKDRFTRHKAKESALKWMPFQMPDNKPIALAFMGDPHVDDDGCNWPLLERDILLLANTKGVYGINCGDLTNNWVGRLMALYAEQSMTKSEAIKVVKWLIQDSGIEWLLVNAGNHDDWNQGCYLLQELVGDTSIMTDWAAKFKIVFPNKVEIRVDLAHDHKGNSQWNPLHAQMKQAKMGDTAHLYNAGHRHEGGIAQHEDPFKNIVYWLTRSRGYKYIDKFADLHGFGSQDYYATVMAVIDPTAEGVNQIMCFGDVEAGCKYLEYLRGRK